MQRFGPVAFAPDELIEGPYDPGEHDLEEGKSIMDIQFHPGSARKSESGESDCLGCTSASQASSPCR